MRRGRAALAALAVAALAAGVAVGAAAGGGGDVTSLQVVFRETPDAGPQRATLRCSGDRAAGTGRLRAVAKRACRVARRERAVLRGGQQDRPCTQVYGGPQTARVTGRLDGARIDRRFDRADGCGIADWRRVEPLLPRTRGAAVR